MQDRATNGSREPVPRVVTAVDLRQVQELGGALATAMN